MQRGKEKPRIDRWEVIRIFCLCFAGLLVILFIWKLVLGVSIRREARMEVQWMAQENAETLKDEANLSEDFQIRGKVTVLIHRGEDGNVLKSYTLIPYSGVGAAGEQMTGTAIFRGRTYEMDWGAGNEEENARSMWQESVMEEVAWLTVRFNSGETEEGWERFEVDAKELMEEMGSA